MCSATTPSTEQAKEPNADHVLAHAHLCQNGYGNTNPNNKSGSGNSNGYNGGDDRGGSNDTNDGHDMAGTLLVIVIVVG